MDSMPSFSKYFALSLWRNDDVTNKTSYSCIGNYSGVRKFSKLQHPVRPGCFQCSFTNVVSYREYCILYVFHQATPMQAYRQGLTVSAVRRTANTAACQPVNVPDNVVEICLCMSVVATIPTWSIARWLMVRTSFLRVWKTLATKYENVQRIHDKKSLC